MLEFLDISLLPKADSDASQNLHQVNLTLDPKEFCVGLIGAESSGVDDLFNILTGTGPRHTGTILWQGMDLSKLRREQPSKIAVVRPTSLPLDPLSLRDSTLAKLLSASHLQQESADDSIARAVEEVLELLSLKEKSEEKISALSDTDRTKAQVATAILQGAELILCDTVSFGLTDEEQQGLIESFKSAAGPGRRILFKARTLKLLDPVDSLILLHEGQLIFHASTEHTLHYFNISEPGQLPEQLKRRTGAEWAASWKKHRATFYQMRAAERLQDDANVSAHKSPASPVLPEQDAARVEFLVSMNKAIRSEIGKLIVGQEEVIDQLLIAILAGGHCLLEGVPGLAKTAVIRSLSQTMQLGFRRIQFTPDLMPADVTGTDILQEDPATGRRSLVFQKGPIFTQMLLADEINRTPAKTQAALLEAMQEHSVTAGGHTIKLEQPFFVLATQNPIEQEGTYPLPEAQKDRFLFHIRVGYPDRESERLVVERTTGEYKAQIDPVINGAQIIECQKTAKRVPVPAHVMDFVLSLVRSTRPDAEDAPAFIRELVSWGAGPRACQCLVSGAKVRALLRGRVHVSVEDIEALALPVLRHRIVPSFKAESEGLDADKIILRLLETLPRLPKQDGL